MDSREIRRDLLSTIAASSTVRTEAWAHTKFTPPALADHVVPRTALVSKLRAAGSSPFVSIAAPTGYGKTTLMAQWALRERRPFAWIALEKQDDDAAALLGYLATAIALATDFDTSSICATKPRQSIWADAVPRFTKQLAELSVPIVLALDEIDHIRSRESMELLGIVARYLPSNCRLAVAGRAAPASLSGRFRAHGLLTELGSDDLALSARETRQLLEVAGLHLTEDEIARLAEKTEGWPAGLGLAALALREEGSRATAATFGGDDRFVADYLRQEHLAGLDPKLLRFLTRSAVLPRMSASVCDFVLERHDSSRQLAAIEEKSLFLVALDHRRQWFRYNRIFRELLLGELVRNEPQLVPKLHARAADWAEEHDMLGAAIDHSDAAGDRERMARLLEQAALPGATSARLDNAERWFRRLDDAPLLATHPGVAILGSRHHAFHGHARDAHRWARWAENGAREHSLTDGSPSEAWLRVLRATRCEHGPSQMHDDAAAAVAALRRDSPWRAPALVELGAAALMTGNDAEADAHFAEAADVADSHSDACTSMVALAERSLVASDHGDYTLAVRLARDARAVAEDNDVENDALRAIERVASVRVALRTGDAQRVQDDLASAIDLTPLLTSAAPWFAAQVHLELARTQLALGSAEGAARPLQAVDEILHEVPDLGVLGTEAQSLKARAKALTAAVPSHAAGLTAAELRLLPYLATHLSFREIGERLFVSRNTVKTQAISVYRKLDVSSRSQAIEQAIERGLVERHTRLPEQPAAASRAQAV